MRAFFGGLTGLRAMVASAFLFAVMAALIKAAAASIPAVEIVFIRNVVHAALFVPAWWMLTDRRIGSVKLRGRRLRRPRPTSVSCSRR